MENKQNYYSNFQCFDNKKRRKAIFGRKVDNNKIEIFEITCSLTDEYNKEYPKNIYKRYLEGLLYGGCHPVIYTIPLDGNKPLWTFNNHCKENYYHKQTITCLYNVEMLKKGFEMKIVNVTKKKVKI